MTRPRRTRRRRRRRDLLPVRDVQPLESARRRHERLSRRERLQHLDAHAAADPEWRNDDRSPREERLDRRDDATHGDAVRRIVAIAAMGCAPTSSSFASGCARRTRGMIVRVSLSAASEFGVWR